MNFSSYKCSSWGVNVTDENYEVGLITGTHASGYDTQNVSEVWFWTGTLEYIPYGIGQKFKNLEKFWVGYEDRNLGLKLLRRSNFKDMDKLWYLDVKYSNVETVDEDTLRDLPNLKYFVIHNNKLRNLFKDTFQKNFKLKHVNANSNELEYLHRDLFKNNALLEEAFFGNNKLKTISIEFTELKFIKKIDFHNNNCIDKSLEDVRSDVAELQTMLHQCSDQGQINLFS